MASDDDDGALWDELYGEVTGWAKDRAASMPRDVLEREYVRVFMKNHRLSTQPENYPTALGVEIHRLLYVTRETYRETLKWDADPRWPRKIALAPPQSLHEHIDEITRVLKAWGMDEHPAAED